MGLPGTAAEAPGADVPDLAKRLEKSEASRAKLQTLLKQAKEIALNNRALLEKHQRLEEEYQVLKQSAEQVTNELEAEKGEAEQRASEEAAKRKEAQRKEAEESGRRKEAERRAAEESRSRKGAEKRAAEEAARRRDAEQRAADLAQLQKDAERKGSEEAARRGAAEKKASEEARGRREAEAEAASLRSTLQESQAAAAELQRRVDQQLGGHPSPEPGPLNVSAATEEAATEAARARVATAEAARAEAAATEAATAAEAAAAATEAVTATAAAAAARVDFSTQTSNELERTASAAAAAAAATEHFSEEGSTNEPEEAEFPTALRRRQRRLGLSSGLAVEHVVPDLIDPGASDRPEAQQTAEKGNDKEGSREEERSREASRKDPGWAPEEPSAAQQLAELRRQVEQQHAEALADALKRAELLSEELERLKGAYGGALLAPALQQEHAEEDLLPHEDPDHAPPLDLYAPPSPASGSQQHKKQQQQKQKQQKQKPVVPKAPQRSPLLSSGIDSPASGAPPPGEERGRRQQQEPQLRPQEAAASPRPPAALPAPSCPLPLVRLLSSPSPAAGDVSAAGFGLWHGAPAPPSSHQQQQQRDQEQHQQQHRGLLAKRSIVHSSEGQAAGDEAQGQGGGTGEPAKKRRTAALDLRETEEAEAARRGKSTARAPRGGSSRPSRGRPAKAPCQHPTPAAAAAAERPERRLSEETAPPMAPASPPRLAGARAPHPQASMTTDPLAELEDRQSQGAYGGRRQGEACLADCDGSGAASEGLDSPAEQRKHQQQQYKEEVEEEAAAEVPEASEAVLEEVAEAVMGYVGVLASGASEGYSFERQSEAVLALELLVTELGAPWALANVAPQLWEGGSAPSRGTWEEEVEEGCGARAVSRAACLELLGALGHALLRGCRGAEQYKAAAAAAKGSPYPRDVNLSPDCRRAALAAAAAICSGLVEALVSGSPEGSSGKGSPRLLFAEQNGDGLMLRLVESTVALAVAVCDASRGPRRKRRRRQQQDPAAAETMEAAGELLLQVELWLRGSRCPVRVSSMPMSLRSLLRTAGLSVV